MQKHAEYLEKYKEYGIVKEVTLPIVKVQGLPNISIGEVVVFENEQIGQVLNVGEQSVQILILSSLPVNVGMKVSRTGTPLNINISEKFLGGVFNPLGQLIGGDLDKHIHTNEAEPRIIDMPPISITQRYQITDPLLTGISIVDLMIPLGKGQRELIAGNRKTGKTSLAFSILKTQIEQGAIGIYVAIGKQSIEIEAARRWFIEEKIDQKLVIIASNADDPQSLIYLAPFSGMTIAEYFRDRGNDVLIVLDDMSNHAKHYREISLIAKKFPGRDSYPGDIFFTHARLLERAGNFVLESLGRVSISCLPIVETTENQLSDYIVSNLIGITDGHILLDSEEFVKGRRPAVNPLLSVTRVGRQTQGPLHQEISQRLTGFINEFRNSQRFSHFGEELGSDIKQIISRGDMVYEFFNQTPQQVVPVKIQILMIGIIWHGWIENGKLPIKSRSSSAGVSLTTDSRSIPSAPQNMNSSKNGQSASLSTSNTLKNQQKPSQIGIRQLVAVLSRAYKEKPDFRQWLDELCANTDWYKMLGMLHADSARVFNVLADIK